MNGNPAKKIKIEDDSHTSSRNVSHNQWLYHELGKVQLTKEDKSAIVDGKRLNNKHISFAQNLLKIQFPEVEGLSEPFCKEDSNWIALNTLYRYYMCMVITG